MSGYNRPKKGKSKLPINNSGYHGQSLDEMTSDLLAAMGIRDKSWLGTGSTPSMLPDFTGGLDPGNVWPGTGKSATGRPEGTIGKTAWDDLLYQAGSSGNDLTRLLSSFGIGGLAPMNGSEPADWNKELLNAILQYYFTVDKRNYDRGLQLDQRIYDSPTNQLARLMGAGVSRDAAIQMLSGGSGGSGAGVPYSAETHIDPGLYPSQTHLNDVQSKTAIANTVFGGISAISGLLSLGFTIPQAVQQTRALSMQNSMSQNALQGLQAADTVLSAFSTLVSAGAMSDDEFNNMTDGSEALNYIVRNKDKSPFSELFNSGAFQRVYGTQLGRQNFQNAWNAVNGTKSDGTILENYIKSQIIQNELGSIQWNQISAEIDKLQAETSFINEDIKRVQQDILESRAQVKYLNKQGRWVDAQSKGKEMENTVYGNSADLLSQDRINKLQLEVDKFTALFNRNDKKDYEAAIDAFLSDQRNANLVAYLKNFNYGAVQQFTMNYPGISKLCSILQHLGIFDKVASIPENYMNHVEKGGQMAAAAGLVL